MQLSCHPTHHYLSQLTTISASQSIQPLKQFVIQLNGEQVTNVA